MYFKKIKKEVYENGLFTFINIFLNVPFPASFLFIYVFSIQLTVNDQYNLFADDWIRTVDLWYWKRLLYQLSHNHFPVGFIYHN